MEIIDSYSEANQSNYDYLYSGFRTAYGQSFTGNGMNLTEAVFYIFRGGIISGNALAKVYAVSGTHGSTAVPTGAALATSDAVAASGISTSPHLETFAFSGAQQITLGNGTKYVVVIEYAGGTNTSNSLRVFYDETSPTHSGNKSTFTTAWGAFLTRDLIFYVNGELPTADDERDAQLTGVAFANSNRTSAIAGASAPILTAEQQGANIRLSWTHDPTP